MISLHWWKKLPVLHCHGEWIGGSKSGKKELQFRQKESICKIVRLRYLQFAYKKNRIENILYLAEFALSLPGFSAHAKRAFSC